MAGSKEVARVVLRGQIQTGGSDDKTEHDFHVSISLDRHDHGGRLVWLLQPLVPQRIGGHRVLDTIDQDAAQLETLLGAVWTMLLPRGSGGAAAEGAYRCLWESSALSDVARAMASRHGRNDGASTALLMTRATLGLTAALHLAGGGGSGDLGAGTGGNGSAGVPPAFADMSAAAWAQPSGTLAVMSAAVLGCVSDPPAMAACLSMDHANTPPEGAFWDLLLATCWVSAPDATGSTLPTTGFGGLSGLSAVAPTPLASGGGGDVAPKPLPLWVPAWIGEAGQMPREGSGKPYPSWSSKSS